MEKIKLLLVLILVTVSSKDYSQESTYIRKGLIKSELTLSPSYMFSEKQSFFYLHGGLEGYVSPKVSITGEAYYYLGDLSSDESTFEYNHSVFFGASRHFTSGNHDLYVGIQPGVSMTRLDEETNNLERSRIGVNPLFSSVVGYNFYVGKFFHFFLQSRIIAGEHNYDINKSLTEVRFSAGLGLNLNTMKK